jgi:thymidylate synthase
MRDGERRRERTGVGARSLFGEHFVLDLREGFPACTTKTLFFSSVRAEVAAFIQGAETLEEFHAMGCRVWDRNAEAWKGARFPGDVGRIYGVQWRRWRWCEPKPTGSTPDGFPAFHTHELDQLRNLVEGIRRDPHGRRHIVTMWNPGELDAMCLPPCPVMFQCFASDDVQATEPDETPLQAGSLDMAVHQRSCDLFLGLPFDVAGYALLLSLIAREVGRSPRALHFHIGDAHVYANHFAQAEEACSREPRDAPRLALSDGGGLFGFLPGDAALEGYAPHPAIPAPMNV